VTALPNPRVTARSYFRRSLALPLAAPAVLLIVGWVFQLTPLWLLSFGFLAYGGVPYLLFALAVFVWSRDRTERELRTAALVAPLVFAPWPGLLYLAIGRNNLSTHWAFESWLELAAITCVVGYLYVLAALFGLHVVKDTHAVSTSAEGGAIDAYTRPTP